MSADCVLDVRVNQYQAGPHICTSQSLHVLDHLFNYLIKKFPIPINNSRRHSKDLLGVLITVQDASFSDTIRALRVRCHRSQIIRKF